MNRDFDAEQRQAVRAAEYQRREKDIALRLHEAAGDIAALSGYIEETEKSFCWRLNAIAKMGLKSFLKRLIKGKLSKSLEKLCYSPRLHLFSCGDDKLYLRWVEAQDRQLAIKRPAMLQHIAEMNNPPRISLVMPVYNPTLQFLEEAVASVQAQWYPHWELCIADDASPDPAIRAFLCSVASEEPRIRLVLREKNGNISAASNSALDIATGDFIGLVDHDDVLPPHALYEVVRAIGQYPFLDIIYSDEDRIDEQGVRSDPYFKPDFSECLLLGQNMVSHFGVYRRNVINSIGGFRLGYEGSQDYDLLLRCVAATTINRIHHIPQVLYHWRKTSSAQTFSESQLDRCTDAARRAIREYLAAKGEMANVEPCPSAPLWSRVRRQLPNPPPPVTVIIPTKDRPELLAKSAEGVLENTDYPDLQLIIVNNNSTETRTLDLFATLSKDARVRILDYPHPFNYSAINNEAVKIASGGVIAFLNNDIEVLEPLWLQEMVSEAIRDSVGAVGAKLLYPDGRVQHAGVVLGMGGVAGHSFQLQEGRAQGYRGLAVLTRNVSAVTAACLVVRKSVFAAVGGFDEQNLPVVFNDVDFCLKVMAAGYENVWVPYAVLIHHESLSRSTDDTPEQRARAALEIEFMRHKWGERLWCDPFYNPNFSLRGDWGLLQKSF
jgi:Predicted glycosyltransferases